MNVCIAHRGWSGKAPENTMAAVRLALQYPDIQAIEIDVQLSKDGVPVLMHDFVLGRTVKAGGSVKDYTWEELKQMDAGLWFDESFKGEHIPSLEEVLTEVRGKLEINIELKAAGDRYPGLEEKVVELIYKYGMEQEVYITSFDHDAIKRVHALAPALKKGLIFGGKPRLIREQLAETGATILSMPYPYVTKDFVIEMIEAGYTVIAWTVDEPDDIQHLLGFHPQLQICTNHPERMIALKKTTAN
ncbi:MULTISPECIES: glycerophosphodiester phosphodiesterase [Aneurinibacillus]|uniref:Glycerophosphodiester phosphodiesterase n=1 Tax=Aneurinibacillus thermoaerophilus TaxID=143495 RepID=A0A1G8AJ35_ANETH|nr:MULTISPECIES: glycerophosphodiester phosphodiesterase family protein [Aneurinibacillus]AMA71516.1 glycerophosphodiester phosphodiesterase [Aneurinibacillus sp. XH2]MED0675300.1 glycerophosphodiester phosphodiesterase family protein [Aneurinibacillus thermoaerophilus]MED0678592.1 glycerophosphodiester phosphodiesterase family protein [Aneurinibacillus thermoaerophilus]MED0738319.1 glycerophosphodiester phosphodiesterase family protein [Aneurinibacillus thermoaerophilus]MED0756546.1 glyceroph